ncbi:MAG TPA: hypothetical protein VN627_12710, partial [Novosphingobium sp.]|nr:hypothetical protein [Novosphingobium sp.]
MLHSQPIANAYDRINPSISDSAQFIAASIDLPDCVHMAIILGMVACANICVPIFQRRWVAHNRCCHFAAWHHVVVGTLGQSFLF